MWTNRYKAQWAEEKKKLREVQTLDFLHKETNNGGRSYYYRTLMKGKTTYIRVDMTAQQQILAMVVLKSPSSITPPTAKSPIAMPQLLPVPDRLPQIWS